MKKGIVIGLMGMFCVPFLSSSQVTGADPSALGYYQNANKFSQSFFGGNARSMSIGGVQTALGGDISSASKNPAGLGVYRSSDFSVSAGMMFNSSKATYNSPTESTITKNNKDNFNIPSIGIVLANKDDYEGADWKSEGLAITYNRLANYNQRFSYEGINENNSFRDYLIDQYEFNSLDDVQFTNNKPNDLLSMAYSTYLLNKNDGSGFENDAVPFWTFSEGESVKQEEEVEVSGAYNQWDVGYGANYQDKLYLGASMGIVSLRHNVVRAFRETTVNETEVNSVEYNQFENTRGVGVNLKIGTIYRANKVVRLGVSVETPTYISLTEEYNSSMNVSYNNVNVIGTDTTISIPNSASDETSTFISDYNVRTPFKINSGIALMAGKKGFISADAELVFHNRTRLSGDNFTFSADNKSLRNIQKTAANIRIGGEYVIDNVRLRGGYALYGSTYDKDITGIDDSKSFITGGIGLKLGEQYFDLAIVSSSFKNSTSPYVLRNAEQPVINNKNQNLSVVFTYGVRF